MLPPDPALEAPFQTNEVPMAAYYLSFGILFILLSIGLLNLAPDPDEVRRQFEEYKYYELNKPSEPSEPDEPDESKASKDKTGCSRSYVFE